MCYMSVRKVYKKKRVSDTNPIFSSLFETAFETFSNIHDRTKIDYTRYIDSSMRYDKRRERFTVLYRYVKKKKSGPVSPFRKTALVHLPSSSFILLFSFTRIGFQTDFLIIDTDTMHPEIPRPPTRVCSLKRYRNLRERSIETRTMNFEMSHRAVFFTPESFG